MKYANAFHVFSFVMAISSSPLLHGIYLDNPRGASLAFDNEPGPSEVILKDLGKVKRY